MHAVVFDVGGTLLELAVTPLDIYCSIFGTRGISIGAGELNGLLASTKARLDSMSQDIGDASNAESTHMSFNMMLLEALGMPCGRDDAHELSREFADRIEFCPFPETESVLRQLSGHFTLGIISNWNLTESLDSVLEYHGLLHYFDYTLASKDSMWEKPNPSIYTYALEKMSARPSDAYYVGDSYIEDVVGPLAVGMTPIFVNRRHAYCPENVKSCGDLTGITEILLCGG